MDQCQGPEGDEEALATGSAPRPQPSQDTVHLSGIVTGALLKIWQELDAVDITVLVLVFQNMLEGLQEEEGEGVASLGGLELPLLLGKEATDSATIVVTQLTGREGLIQEAVDLKE